MEKKAFRPSSYAEFKLGYSYGLTKFNSCISCNEPFSKENIHSIEGWRETQISGLCEYCFDNVFKDQEK
jgi:hypothetical protein